MPWGDLCVGLAWQRPASDHWVSPRKEVVETNIVWFVGGLVALAVGAEIFVRGAAGLAAALRISPVVIGLTVVAFGTSAPELTVSLTAAYRGKAEMAVANAVGSNIFNVLAILGLSALIKPLVVSSRLVWIDVPLMIVISGLLLVLGWDGQISQQEGIGLFLGVVAYTVWLIVKSRMGYPELVEEVEEHFHPHPSKGKSAGFWLAVRAALMLGGLTLLVLGSDYAVYGASKIAESLGISRTIIGLTIVAAGTSLPEAAASVVATIRGHRDIAVGNVVGSNIFNVLCVIGLSAAVSRGGVGLPIDSELLRIDIPIMIAVAVACLPIFVSGHLISRREGLVLFLYYLAYLGFLWLKATDSGVLLSYEVVVLAFVVPLTAWFVILSTLRHFRRSRPGGDVSTGII